MREVCATKGCEWHTEGTVNGAPNPLCRGYGGYKGCAMDWLSNDPEDLEPYDEWLAQQGM